MGYTHISSLSNSHEMKERVEHTNMVKKLISCSQGKCGDSSGVRAVNKHVEDENAKPTYAEAVKKEICQKQLFKPEQHCS